MIIVSPFLVFLTITSFPKEFAKEMDEIASGDFDDKREKNINSTVELYKTLLTSIEKMNGIERILGFSADISQVLDNTNKIQQKVSDISLYLDNINKRLDALEERSASLEAIISFQFHQDNKLKPNSPQSISQLLPRFQKLEKSINSTVKYFNNSLNNILNQINKTQNEICRNTTRDLNTLKPILKNHINITQWLLQQVLVNYPHYSDHSDNLNLHLLSNFTEHFENKLINISSQISVESEKLKQIFNVFSNNLAEANLHVFAIKVFNVSPDVKAYADILRETFAASTDVSTVSDSRPLGSSCISHSQCTTAIQWSACLNGVCRCPYGEINQEDTIHCRQQPYLGRTCSEIHHNGFLESDYYLLYPYGPCNESYRVFCNMTFPGFTTISHNYLGAHNISGPIPGNYYYAVLSYTLSWDAIEKIISLSAECHQFVNFSCGDNSLIKGLGQNFAPWRSRQGEWQNNWGGAPTDSGKCACAMNNSCNHKSVCNCNNIAKYGVDNGYLIDKAFLPVSAVQYGDLDDADEFAFHEIGPLECSGW